MCQEKKEKSRLSFSILSLFPGYFDGPFRESMLKRAQESGLIEISLIDIRSYSEDRHNRVDDRPFGGGPGMVMKAEPVAKAIRDVKEKGSKVIYLSPQGKPLTAKLCRSFSEENHLILLSGHYEGIDERVIESEVDETVSIGDYVLTSGCSAAIVFVDAVSRFVPGVVGDEESVIQDSFEGIGLLDHPHYTQPRNFEGRQVPEVLLSGDHAKIEAWRRARAEENTKMRRPELLKKRRD